MTHERPWWDKRRKAQAAIAAIAIGVVAFDVLCEDGGTITEETRRLRDTKLGKYLVPFIIRSVAAHLLEEVDPEHDWIHQVAKISPKKPKLTGEDRFDVYPTDD